MTRRTKDADSSAYRNPDNPEDPFSPQHHRICPSCGKEFWTYTRRIVYCTITCQKRQNYINWKQSHPDSYQNHKTRMRLRQQAKRILQQADSLKKGK